MNKIILIIFTLLISSRMMSIENDTIRGNVTYINAQHVYVRFQNTDKIQAGDTLYTLNNKGEVAPVLVVISKSSISGVCTPVSGSSISKDLLVFRSVKSSIRKAEVKEELSPGEVLEQLSAKNKNKENTEISLIKNQEGIAVNDLLLKEKRTFSGITENVNGRISVSSYTNLSNQLYNYQRMRYNLSLSTGVEKKGNITTDSYLSYNQKLSDKSPFTHELKIYSLSASYFITDKTSVTLGRKLNPGMANIGAVDGLQIERKEGNWAYGAVAGSRPDISNYGLNLNLMQFGAYGSYKLGNEKWNFQSTVAVFNQMNQWKTDRRFLYFQHNQQFSPALSFFGSMEMDLYSKQNGISKTDFNLTGMYLSLRYKPVQKLSLSLNYDARKNIYYYETYKNFIDSLYDKETRQGLRFQTLWRPTKKIVWNTYVGYRMANSVDKASTNGSTSLTYNGLPWIDGSLSARFTALSTNYLKGYIVSGEFEHDLIDNMSLNVNYQYVNYDLLNSGVTLLQHIAEVGLYWRINKKWIVSLDNEISLERNSTLNNRLFVNLTKRF